MKIRISTEGLDANSTYEVDTDNPETLEELTAIMINVCSKVTEELAIANAIEPEEVSKVIKLNNNIVKPNGSKYHK